MKRVLCLILVFVSLFALASCSGKKKSDPQNNDKPLFEEEVVKEISAEEGGTVANSDGSVSIEIPADALESDTTITMRIYDAKDYPGTEDKTVISKVVEFEPSGTIFKKPVMISMVSEGTGETLRAPKKKVVTAAVYREEKGKWSYSPVGAAVKIGKDAAGDPIMMNAAGDPIMLNDNGDPIMMSAAGDPIMLSAAGDPIMVTAAGDPIMNSAAGDPIMMTTGHFTAYAFFFVEFEEGENKPVEEPTEEPDDDKDDSEVSDEEEDTDTSDTEISDEDDDIDISDIEISDEDEIPDETEDEDIIVPEPEKVYSKVLCTGMAICTDGEGKQILCPKESEELYGQDAQYASRKGCVAHSYSEIENPEMIDISRDLVHLPPFIKDDVTGLTWWFTYRQGSFEEMKDECAVSYGGIEDWRLPTPQEVATLSDLGMLYGSKIDPVYFEGLYSETEMQPEQKSYYGYDLILTSLEGYFYMLQYGVIMRTSSGGLEEPTRSSSPDGYLMCVSGEKYGEVSAETYSTVTENGQEMILDSSTNLFWQKEPVKKATWKEALDYCESLDYAGHSDWRLPNKNELLSLVDYSKLEEAEEESVDEPELRDVTEEEDEVVAISSFPGMTPDLFWTSTPAPVDYLVWLIHMQYGVVFPSGEVENPEDEPIVGPQQPRSVKSIKRDEIAEEEDAPAVLCVRSDLAEKEETPECDGTGPCIDENGITWSSRLYPEIFAGFDKSYIGYARSGRVYFYGLAEMCRNLNENGSNKWRLPTIDEIRKTVTDEKLKFGGSCPVTDEHFTDSYFDEEACTGDTASRTTLNDYGIIMSGTFNIEYWDMGQEQSPELWYYEGMIEHGFSVPLSDLVQRCVLDETLDDYETAPYTDPETGIRWSELAPDELLWSEATEFCAALNEDDPENFWRLPTTAELQTLLRNCEEAPCRMTVDGRYSVFGDISYFWTSDLNEGNVKAVDFTDGSIYTLQTDSYAADVRCVSGGESACAGNPCNPSIVENATGICFTVTDPESGSGYVCECDEESSWYDGACRQVAVVN